MIILVLFCFTLGYLMGIMPSICFFSFAKKPPLYKTRNYSSASVRFLVIIFFQHFEIYSQIYRYCYQGLDSCAWFTEVGLVQPAGGHPVNCEQLAQITYDLWKEPLLAIIIPSLVFTCKALSELSLCLLICYNCWCFHHSFSIRLSIFLLYFSVLI